MSWRPERATISEDRQLSYYVNSTRSVLPERSSLTATPLAVAKRAYAKRTEKALVKRIVKKVVWWSEVEVEL